MVVPNADSMYRKLGLAMGMLMSLDGLMPRDHNAVHVHVYCAQMCVCIERIC